MKKRLLALLVLLAMLPGFALASGQYIIPDSDRRFLTKQELWGWDYESLGFILNEIFARHGYNFNAGSKYDNYFRSRPWYAPNDDPDNHRACYPKLNDVEWANERLVKDIRTEMRAKNDRNEGGMNYLDYIDGDAFDALSGFTYMELRAGQKLAVYSAPSAASWRGANGKASVSTNDFLFVAGWENGWLLLMYETNNGSVRVGYADGSTLKGGVDAPYLQFQYRQARLAESAALTDDPARAFSSIRRLNAGDTVTYLSTYQNRYSWAYVETVVDGQTVRGFIPSDALEIGNDMEENG